MVWTVGKRPVSTAENKEMWTRRAFVHAGERASGQTVKGKCDRVLLESGETGK